MDKIELRPVDGKPDFYEIKPLITGSWPKEFGDLTEEEIIEIYENDYDTDLDFSKVLYVDNLLAGWYRYSNYPREAGSEDIHCYDISLLPEFQRQSLGLIMMRDMIKTGRIKGFRKLLSRSFIKNEGSIKLHRASGFSEHLRTEDSIVWEIDLQSLNPDEGE